jgi:hypothetical protein
VTRLQILMEMGSNHSWLLRCKCASRNITAPPTPSQPPRMRSLTWDGVRFLWIGYDEGALVCDAERVRRTSQDHWAECAPRHCACIGLPQRHSVEWREMSGACVCGTLA